MIVKVPKKKPDTKSSFSRLANYILDAPKDGEKVLDSWGENVFSEDRTDMIKEIVQTQKMNQNTKADKTYHLVVSFPAGEQPDREVLRDIDKQVSDALGLGEHERIVAVHDDTAHVHMHIAINKVHPETSKVVTPFRDFKTLYGVARDLEIKHGLQVLEPEKDKADSQVKLSANANDVEQHGKAVSFTSWAIDTLQKPLSEILDDKNTSWEDLHRVLADKGLILKPRGRGFIITTENGKLFVKPSAINRDLSKAKLEKKLGVFKSANLKLKKCPYRREPLVKNKETDKLFKDFKTDKARIMTKRKAAFANYAKTKTARYDSIKDEYASLRHELWRNSPTINVQKKMETSKALTIKKHEAFLQAREEMAALRDQIRDETKAPTWTEYLLDRASNGDEVSRLALKTHERKQKKAGNHIAPSVALSRDQSIYIDNQLKSKPRANKNGSLTYQIGASERLIVDKNAIHVYGKNDETLKTALLVAQKQYGQRLKINGDAAFLASCNATIKKHNLNINIKQREVAR